MEPEVLLAVAAFIIIIIVQVAILRWVFRINKIVEALNEQNDYLEDIAFRLKKCAEKMGVCAGPYDEDIVTAK